MQYQNQILQPHEAEALFTELGEDELDAVVGGYGWSDFKRQAGNAVSDIGKGVKDGVRGDTPRRDTLAYNLSYGGADILDN